jgi:hypothetical protein
VAAAAASLLVVLDALVAVSVVDLAGLGVAQDIVSLGNLDELLMGCFISPGMVSGYKARSEGQSCLRVLVWMELLGQLAISRLELLVGSLLVYSEDLLRSVKVLC